MRLTYKDENGYWHEDVEIYSREQRIEKRIVKTPVGTKLGQLEDIEDELGIDLITLFKATKGIWIKRKDKIIHIADNVWVNLSTKKLGCTCVGKYEGHWPTTGFDDLVNGVWHSDFRNYGKDWALTKEELL